jgi:hypothetical protein
MQAAGNAAPFRREGQPPAKVNPYIPRAEPVILGCDGCGREGHTADQCYSKKHPNWNSQHATVKWKESAIAKEIRKLANGPLRSLPPEGVQWLPDNKVWIGGEKLRAWKLKIVSSSDQSQPNHIKGKMFHLSVVRGGTEVNPSVQGTITTMSMEGTTNHIVVAC